MTKCPCCGWSEERQRRVDEVMREMAKRFEQLRESQKHLPRGDCRVCCEQDTPCDFSCVGV